MTDSCFIDDTSSRTLRAVCGTYCHIIQLLWLLCLQCRPSPRTGSDEYVGLEWFTWLATSWDAFSRYRTSGLLGGHMLDMSVCLTQLAREIKESHAADRDHRSTQSNGPIGHQPINLPGKDMGLIIGHYLHKNLHQFHKN